jgi:predicted transposase/invertase (TIGR01784 family)
MPFDLFGEDRYIYTFTMKSDENPEIELKDGATRIFLNTHGKNKDEVSPDLIELLSYIEYTNDLGDDEIQSKYVRDLKRHVDSIKHDREVSVRYMQKWEEMAYEREEGREEGRREGEIVQAKKTVFNLMNMGLSIKEISKAVDTDENTVQEWINTGDLKRVDF